MHSFGAWVQARECVPTVIAQIDRCHRRAAAKFSHLIQTPRQFLETGPCIVKPVLFGPLAWAPKDYSGEKAFCERLNYIRVSSVPDHAFSGRVAQQYRSSNCPLKHVLMTFQDALEQYCNK